MSTTETKDLPVIAHALPYSQTPEDLARREHERKYVIQPGYCMMFFTPDVKFHQRLDVSAVLKQALPAYDKYKAKYVVLGSGIYWLDTRVFVPVVHAALAETGKTHKIAGKQVPNEQAQNALEVSKAMSLASMLAAQAQLVVQQSAEAKDATALRKVLETQYEAIKKSFGDIKSPMEWTYGEVQDLDVANVCDRFPITEISCGVATAGNVLFRDTKLGQYATRILYRIVDVVKANEGIHVGEQIKPYCMATVEEAANVVAKELTLDEYLGLSTTEAEKRFNDYLKAQYLDSCGILIRVEFRDKLEDKFAERSDARKYRRRGRADIKETILPAAQLQSNREEEELIRRKVEAYHKFELEQHQAQLQREAEEKNRERNQAEEEKNRERKEAKDKADKAKKKQEAMDKMAEDHELEMKKLEYARLKKAEEKKLESKEVAVPADVQYLQTLLGKSITFEQLMEWRRVEVVGQAKQLNLTADRLLGAQS